MFILLKEIGVVLIWLFTATLAGFGIYPEPAVAPDLAPPVRIVAEAGSQNTDQGSLQEEAETTPPEIEEIAPKETPHDPFTDLAEAFARLAEEAPSGIQDSPSLNVNETVRGALVNIICITETSGPFNSISASGVIIDSRGVILTNAHVAQFFLLENYPKPGFVKCSIRTGSPAEAKYTAELLYLPPSWIEKNAHKIDDERPMGNGEHDYALVRITGVVNKNVALPGAFPALSVALGIPDTGNSVLVAGYPAGFLGGITVAKELYAASAQATVGQLYTFGSQSIDLFSIGGSIVAQQGSSGGAVANERGALTGVIVTSSDAPDTASRDLRALTTRYVVNDFQKESGVSLASFLSGNLAQNALTFRLTVAPALTKALVDVLEKQIPSGVKN